MGWEGGKGGSPCWLAECRHAPCRHAELQQPGRKRSGGRAAGAGLQGLRGGPAAHLRQHVREHHLPAAGGAPDEQAGQERVPALVGPPPGHQVHHHHRTGMSKTPGPPPPEIIAAATHSTCPPASKRGHTRREQAAHTAQRAARQRWARGHAASTPHRGSRAHARVCAPGDGLTRTLRRSAGFEPHPRLRWAHPWPRCRWRRDIRRRHHQPADRPGGQHHCEWLEPPHGQGAVGRQQQLASSNTLL